MVYLIGSHQLAPYALHFALMKDFHSNHLWIDSTTLAVFKNQLIGRHKSMKAISTRGKSSMGWFFDCKLHLVINQLGEVISTALSNGHIADIKMVEQLVKGLRAKLYADRGCISQNLKQSPENQGIELITYHRKNMQAVKLSKADAYNLRQRNKIEILFSLLRGKYNLQTSKARRTEGF